MKTLALFLSVSLSAATSAIAQPSAPSGAGSVGAPAPASPAPGALNSAGTTNSAPAAPGRTGLPSSTNNINNANPMNATGITGANPTAATGSDTIHSPGATLSRQQVLDAQRALSANGYHVTQDGIAGASTSSAVRRFQASQGLPQTGELDSRTITELNAATQSVPPKPSKAQDVPVTF